MTLAGTRPARLSEVARAAALYSCRRYSARGQGVNWSAASKPIAQTTTMPTVQKMTFFTLAVVSAPGDDDKHATADLRDHARHRRPGALAPLLCRGLRLEAGIRGSRHHLLSDERPDARHLARRVAGRGFATPARHGTGRLLARPQRRGEGGRAADARPPRAVRRHAAACGRCAAPWRLSRLRRRSRRPCLGDRLESRLADQP